MPNSSMIGKQRWNMYNQHQALLHMPNQHHNAEDNPGYTGRSSPKITAHTPYKRHNELLDESEST